MEGQNLPLWPRRTLLNNFYCSQKLLLLKGFEHKAQQCTQDRCVVWENEVHCRVLNVSSDIQTWNSHNKATGRHSVPTLQFLLATPLWEPRSVTYIFTRFITLQLNPNLLILLQLFNNLCNCLEIQERDHWNRSWVIKSCNSTDWNYPEFKTQTALALQEGKLRLQSQANMLSSQILPNLPPAHNSGCGTQAVIQRDFPFYTGCCSGRYSNGINCLSHFVP